MKSAAVEVAVPSAGPSAAAVGAWTRALLRELDLRRATVSVLLCGAARMRALNRTFRGKDRPTDVLSFSPVPDPARPPRRVPPGAFLGELVVCVPVAVRQARRCGHSPGREIRILLAHGLLHLLGYDHETDGGTMLRRQQRLVRAAFGPGPDGVPEESGGRAR